jgi:hypothetical protein
MRHCYRFSHPSVTENELLTREGVVGSVAILSPFLLLLLLRVVLLATVYEEFSMTQSATTGSVSSIWIEEEEVPLISIMLSSVIERLGGFNSVAIGSTKETLFAFFCFLCSLTFQT